MAFVCEVCDKNFNTKGSLYRHKRGVHGLSVEIPGNIHCREDNCQFTCSKIENLKQHHESFHGKTCMSTAHTFPTFQDFLDWKEIVERESQELYVQSSSKKALASGSSRTTYSCHRSGVHKSKSTGKRRPRSQGTCKTGEQCTARIIATVSVYDTVEAVFHETHSCHKLLLGKQKISDEECIEISEKRRLGIPMQIILDEIRDKISPPSQQPKLKVVTSKIFKNIRQELSLDEEHQPLRNSAMSGDPWIQNMLELDDNPVLLYKKQGHLCKKGVLEVKDFMLAIMTAAQREIMKLCGTNVICVDSIPARNMRDFQVTTILTVDEYGQGIPVAFCLSNRKDSVAMTLFFESVRDKVGTLLTDTFISNDLPAFYNSWLNVMGDCGKRLLCAWHVDRCWRKNLLKITSRDKQVLIYKSLRFLIEEQNKKEFLKMLESFIEETIADPETTAFAEYFVQTFSYRAECWAYCYRSVATINANFHLETVHRVVKFVFLEGKEIRRLDICVNILLKFVRDKVFEHELKVHKGKLLSILAEINKRHKLGATLNVENIKSVSNTSWEVTSSTSNDIYFVCKNETTCTSCEITCDLCDICIHNYSCTCTDSVLQKTICKHVHAVLLSCNNGVSHKTVRNVATNVEPENVDSQVKFLFEISRSFSIKFEIDSKLQHLQSLFKNEDVNEELQLKMMNTLDELISHVQKYQQKNKEVRAESCEPVDKKSLYNKNLSDQRKRMLLPKICEGEPPPKMVFAIVHSGFDHTHTN